MATTGGVESSKRGALAALGHALLTPSASIGVTVASLGDDPAVVLSHAAGAMYQAKQRGRARCEFYAGVD
jgi:GGDEF domain-containing protein